MTSPPDENDRLTILLRSIATPEPPPGFLAGARRRYLEAREARYRREVFAGLAAGSLGLLLATALLLSVFGPADLIAWGAVVAAGATRWTTGIGIVLSIVPLAVWASGAVGVVVSLFPIALLARARWPVVVK